MNPQRGWRLDFVAVRWSQSYSTPGPVSTGMGDLLWAGKLPRFVTSRSGKLSLLPSLGRKMSTSQSVVTLCGWGVKAGMVHSTCGKTV